MMFRNSIAVLAFISVLQMTYVTAFQAARIPTHKLSQSFHPSSDRSSTTSLYATSYDPNDGFGMDERGSAEESNISSDKKERVTQIMVIALGAFFAWSVIVVLLDTASFLTGSMSHALDIGKIFNFLGSVIGAVAGATWTGLKVAAPVVGKGVISAGQAAAPYVQEASQRVSEVATPYVQEAAQRISEAASPVMEQAAQAMSEAASPYVSAMDSTINSAASAVSSTLDTTIVAPIKGVTDSVVSTVDSTVKATTDSVVTAVDSSIKGAAEGVSSTLKGVTDGAMESIKNISPF